MAIKTLLAALTALSLMTLARARISPAGRTVVVNDITYYVGPEPVSVIDATAEQLKTAATAGVDLIPLTVIEDKTSAFTKAVFRLLASSYIASDDVFNIGFLQAVYLKHSGTAPATVNCTLGDVLNEYGYGIKLFMPSRAYQASVGAQGYKITEWQTELPAGPYFMSASTGEVYPAYRLYSDVQGAFTEGLKPNSDGTFSVLSASIPGVQTVTVGVPSRLHFTKTAAEPLAGVRVGVKDIYDIAGVKTSCGNRAYFDLYPERSQTATAVQNLIDAGAVVVGKMKTSQFAHRELATAQWVDYHCPFNPRGDGYQDPASSGPGAGIAAYDWLDLTLDVDTGGSIRGASGVNGCYGNRPSTGLVSLKNTMPLSPGMDTAGFLVRDPLLWHTAAKAMYKENINSNFNSFPTKIIVSNFPTSATPEAQAILSDFVTKVTSFLNASTSTLDVDSLWSTTRPAAANRATLAQFVGTVYPILTTRQQYRLLTDPFYSDYAAAHGNRRPFINQVPLDRWAYRQRFPATAEREALVRKKLFTDWWESHVVLKSKESCSDSILLYPGAMGNPDYRDKYITDSGVTSGFSIGRVSTLAGVPDVVFPIGQASYQSTVTLSTEFLPVTVDIVAAKGCDGMLFELAAALNKAGILKTPKTGRVPF